MADLSSSRKIKNIILLPIRPKFANQIYHREKSFEFRKPLIPSDIDYVILLETGSRDITGGFSVGKIHEMDVSELWDTYGQNESEKERFTNYFSNWEEGIAIEVEHPEMYRKNIPIDDITVADPSFNIPDRFSFIYMSEPALRIIAPHSDELSHLLPDSKTTTLDDWNLNPKDME